MELLVGDVVRNAAAAVPGRLAVACPAGEASFADVDRLGDAAAHRLAASGAGLGDRVVVWADGSVALAGLYVGVARCGGVFAPINTRFGVDEAEPMAGLARPSVLVVDDEHADAAEVLARRLGVPWLRIGDVATGDAPPFEPPRGLTGTSPHVVFFTSGSTGRPKGVVLSHQATVLRSHPGAMLEPRGRLVCPFPLFHMAAWTMAMQQWHARDGIVFTATAEGADICEAIARHRATRVYFIPAVWRRVLDHLAAHPTDVSSLRFADTGTSATPPALLEEIAAAVPGAARRVFYGSTEAANVASLADEDMAARPGSCGVPSPMVQVRVADDGELLVRSPMLFDGYFDDPEATAAAVVDGWYRTGDRVEADADGFLYVTGRTNAVIRSGGESVDPTEVEQVLLDHADVIDVAVVGVPDAQWGEVVCAVVVPRDGSAPTVDELRAHCAGRLAPHKHPRRVELVAAIPRTQATMQVQRSLVLDLLR